MVKTTNVHGGNVHKASRLLHTSLDQILDFSANINPLGMSSKGLDAVKDALQDVIHYPDPDMTHLYSITSELWNIPKECIVFGNGAAELIYAICRLPQIEGIYVPAPGFSEYSHGAKSCGLPIVEYPLEFDEHIFSFSYDLNTMLQDLQQSKHELVFIGNPNNPCGTLWNQESHELFEVCKNNGHYLVFDESFIDFLGDAYSMRNYVKEYDNVIVVHSLTKFYAVPGLRIGAMMANPMITQFIKDHIPAWSVNHIAQIYSEEALQDVDYIKRTRTALKTEKEWLYKELMQMDSLQCIEPSVNYILCHLHEQYSLEDMIQNLCHQSILLRDCSQYTGLGPNWFRVAVKTRKQNQQLIQALQAYFRL
ncbi:threonine-phosphate decarboxylase CobD [Veillonella sp. VA141]|uniref:threonine-phosphate decarboxylase CobD n=1 Tax=Veillonella sp. VA141 TaxID=741833 RepID=UPI000F8EC6B0|nr:threonine-phosphate decarboxylase CobD [Veillonella sp. VA141]